MLLKAKGKTKIITEKTTLDFIFSPSSDDFRNLFTTPSGQSGDLIKDHKTSFEYTGVLVSNHLALSFFS